MPADGSWMGIVDPFARPRGHGRKGELKQIPSHREPEDPGPDLSPGPEGAGITGRGLSLSVKAGIGPCVFLEWQDYAALSGVGHLLLSSVRFEKAGDINGPVSKQVEVNYSLCNLTLHFMIIGVCLVFHEQTWIISPPPQILLVLESPYS